MEKITFYIVAFLLFDTSLSFGQIQNGTVNGWYVADTLNVWEASSRIITSGGIWEDPNGDNYQVFRLKVYDSGKPASVDFEKTIPKIKTPIGFIWFSGLVAAFPAQSYIRYMFFIGDSSGLYPMEQPYEFYGGDPFAFMLWEGYFRTALPDSIDRVSVRIYPAPYTNNVVRIMELGLDYLRGIDEDQNYFLIDSFEDTTIVGIEDELDLPESFTLFQNYTNPFNPTTSIRYSVLSSTYVNLIVYDMLGREVTTLVNEEKHPGEYTITFNASGLSSGIYFYRLTAGQYTETKKMMLMR